MVAVEASARGWAAVMAFGLFDGRESAVVHDLGDGLARRRPRRPWRPRARRSARPGRAPLRLARAGRTPRRCGRRGRGRPDARSTPAKRTGSSIASCTMRPRALTGTTARPKTGKAQLLALGDVAAGTVDDDAGDAAPGRGQGEDPAEAGHVDPAVVRDHQDVAVAGGLDRGGRDVLGRPVLLARARGDRAGAPDDGASAPAQSRRMPVVAPARPSVSRASETAQVSRARSRSSERRRCVVAVRSISGRSRRRPRRGCAPGRARRGRPRERRTRSRRIVRHGLAQRRARVGGKRADPPARPCGRAARARHRSRRPPAPRPTRSPSPTPRPRRPGTRMSAAAWAAASFHGAAAAGPTNSVNPCGTAGPGSTPARHPRSRCSHTCGRW